MSLLEIEDLDIFYGDFQALYSLNVHVSQGETLAVIGANGAGKSTLMKAIAGVVTIGAGSISYQGRDIKSLSAFRRVQKGISLTPEGRKIFRSLTVEENLKVGGHTKRKGPWNLSTVYEAFPLVSDRRDRLGINLSGGEQQAAAIGRALMSNPDLLLLDEVSLGLAPVVVEQIYAALPKITSQGTTILLVEQDVSQALKVSDRIQCLLEGRTALEGVPKDLDRAAIANAYFGIQ